MHALARQSERKSGGRVFIAQAAGRLHEALKPHLLDHMFYFCSKRGKSQSAGWKMFKMYRRAEQIN